MMIEYDVSRPIGRCHATGREFVEGESFYSALFETAEGFERRDFCEEVWQGPPAEALCYYKTRLPRKEEPKRRLFVDDDVLVNFFLRIAETTEVVKLRFRFVLSLILLRKRLLKYERTIRSDGAEFWELRLMKDRTLHRVRNPQLDETQIAELTGELSSILSGQWPGDPMNNEDISPTCIEGTIP